LKAAGQRRTPKAAKGATVYGLDATVRARGVAAAVQKAAASMKIAGRKIKPPVAFAGPPGSAQKALGIALLTPRRWSKID